MTISGGGTTGDFQVVDGATATLSGLTITDGVPASRAGGGVSNGGTVTLNDCTFSGNSAIYGGGLDNDYGTATLNDCTISGNSAGFAGGGGVQQTRHGDRSPTARSAETPRHKKVAE